MKVDVTSAIRHRKAATFGLASYMAAVLATVVVKETAITSTGDSIQ